MEYDFRHIEKKWQQYWKDAGVYKMSNESDKPKYYVLDMFPYPSGAGLHVGHPLGYIASDIYSRFKRLNGFNVLHPMGFDSFGLPAEQYAIETGQHPAVTTAKNIERYHEQLDNIGFCYDWSREVKTSDPGYYRWTQYIFLQLFNSWYNRAADRTENISTLLAIFDRHGSEPVLRNPKSTSFTAAEWRLFHAVRQQEILMEYRVAYSAFGDVNWCEALGTVLANDEVINGISERGGHPVEKKKMRQWYLRITEYADRLLKGLEQVDYSDAMKEMQRNWIGKSEGAEITFRLTPLTPTPSPRRGEGDTKIKANENTQEKETDKKEDKSKNFPGSGYADYKVDNFSNLENANTMRITPTEAENILWNALRNRSIGYKFRRQHPVENYIADLICLDVWLVIEIDGGYHTTAEQKTADSKRDIRLREIGFTTLRFTNEEVLQDFDNVLSKISTTANEIKNTSIQRRLEIKSSSSLDTELTDQTTDSSEESAEADGASPLQGETGVRVYTTRPDTIFGVDFMVLAPEHELVNPITTPGQKEQVSHYLDYVKSRSERERMAEVKQITGAFTGAYVYNPFDGRAIPVWISEYVLAGYGTGAIMAVPCGDQRDFNFAKHFNIPITNIIGNAFNGQEANPTKDAILQHSGFLNGMVMRNAMPLAIDKLEEEGIGKRQINYRMRDAGFSRQRYWGEPFPIVYKGGAAYALDEKELPLELPYLDTYGPGPEGEGPLANILDWEIAPGGGRRETNTMPGYAGSSWYFLRYMDPDNNEELVNRKVADYWGQVDLYIGGTEHAVGHLLYSRMWTKALYDLGYIGFDEPYKKLVNQGMIQGSSRFVYRVLWGLIFDPETDVSKLPNVFISKNIEDGIKTKNLTAIKKIQTELSSIYFKIFDQAKDFFEEDIYLTALHVDVNLVDGVDLDIEAFRRSKPENASAIFILEEGQVLFPEDEQRDISEKYICGVETEKMSKSKYNVVNPDEIVNKYGADTFRMYEMFLGPVEQSKPWDTKGIEGVFRFLRKFWRLYVDEQQGFAVTNESATPAELKVLHKTIKKITEDTERFSFNTAVSAFMVCVNELNDLKCHKQQVLEPLLIMLTPYAPHITEELYQLLGAFNGIGNQRSVLDAVYPRYEQQYLVESSKEYPVSVNGKLRTTLTLSLDATQQEVEKLIIENQVVQKWLEGRAPKKVIYVKNKMVNVVI